jgi:2-oxoglutarate ferredoxin oxidoreductase subunit gamma
MSRTEILICGVGGQGVVLSGILLGTAATLFDNKQAVQTQSYSSEIRGGSARSEVIIDEKRISDPEVRKPDILIALAQEALDRAIKRVKPNGLVVVDSDRVRNVEPGDYEVVSVPASSIAEKEMGDSVVANLVILGALIRRRPVISARSIEKAIEAVAPPKAKMLNIAAFQRGLRLMT